MENVHPTGEIVTIDAKGKVYKVNRFTEVGERSYALADGTLVIRTGESQFQIAGTKITLRTLLTPQDASLDN